MNRRLIFIAFIVALIVMAVTAAAVVAGGNATGGNATGGNATGGNATDDGKGGKKPSEPVCVEGYDCEGDPFYTGANLVQQVINIFAVHEDDPFDPWAEGVQGTLYPLEVSTFMKGVSDDWAGDITVTFSLDIICKNHGGQVVPSDQHPKGESGTTLTVLATDADKNGKITVTEIVNEIDVLNLLANGAGCQPSWTGAIEDLVYESVSVKLDNVDTPEDNGGNANTIEMFYNCAVDGHESRASDLDSIQCELEELNNPVPGPKG